MSRTTLFAGILAFSRHRRRRLPSRIRGSRRNAVAAATEAPPPTAIITTTAAVAAADSIRSR